MENPKFDARKFDNIYQKLCSSGLTPENGPNGSVIFSHSSGGKITIYKKGTTNIQGTSDAKPLLYELWTAQCSDFRVMETEGVKTNQILVFYVPGDKWEEVKSLILEFAKSCGYGTSVGRVEHTLYSLIFNDDKNNRVTVSQYMRLSARGAKLMLQGLGSDLWDNVSEYIGNILGASFQTEIAKVRVSVETNAEIEVYSVITSEDKKAAEVATNQSLGNCYNFLSPHDKGLIESSEFLLQSNIPVSNYFAFVSGTIRSFEGYLKQVVIKLGAYPQAVVHSKDWDFGTLIANRRPLTLNHNIARCLSRDNQSKRNRQEGIIEKLINAIYQYRHTSFHNPGRVYTSLASAKSVHNDLVRLMKDSYDLLEMEIN